MIKELEHWRTQNDIGLRMPWYTRPCLEWLDTIDFNGLHVFEYGCGDSSKFYHYTGANLLGVDSNKEWIFFPEKQAHITDPVAYTKAIELAAHRAKSDFDFIIIDGDYRDDCTEHALKHLKKGGYLIADNFEQASADLAHWPKTRELTKDMPVTFYKEHGHPDWCTAVFHNV